jgi:hypothetical protein
MISRATPSLTATTPTVLQCSPFHRGTLEGEIKEHNGYQGSILKGL